MLPQIIFWISLFILFHSYVGYALIAAAIAALRKSTLRASAWSDDFCPDVALIIPAYNEEDCLEKKIQNCLELDYDQKKITIIFITDGSDDGTLSLLSNRKEITWLHEAERKGKAAAINRAIQFTTQEIVILSDANTILNAAAIREIVRHYADERVGGVAGEKKILSTKKANAAGSGEGFYWKYESWLKSVDSRFHSVVGAAGELFSFRRNLYTPLPEDTILDDFIMSLGICLKGFVIKYEPAAFALESASSSISEEKKRKVRISAGGFQSIGRLPGLFNVFKHPALTYLYVSHRVLRWTVCPFLLPVIFVANCFLMSESTFYLFTLVIQLIFYWLALGGRMLSRRNIRVSAFYVPYYFVFMNLSLMEGLWLHLFGKPTVLWDKSQRSAEITTKR